MANPKQFVRSKSHRQFFGFYLMNWSTWQLKGKPYHLKEKLKPYVAVSLEAAARWCWVPVPTLLLELPSWPGCAKDIPKRVVWPESYSTCWRIPKWKSLHEYSILCNLDFCSIFCYKEMFSSSSPYSCGGRTDIPPQLASPRAPGRIDGPIACWLSNSCSPGSTLHAVTSWKEINSPER